MKLLLFPTFLIWFIFPAFAQTDSMALTKVFHSIGLKGGAAHVRFIDEGFTYNRLLFKGTLPAFQLDYTRHSAKTLFQVLARMSNGNVKTKYGKLPAGLTQMQLSLQYARNAIRYSFFGLSSTLSVGLNMSASLHYVGSGTLLKESAEWWDNEDYFFLYGLNLLAVQRMQLKANKTLTLAFVLPVAALSKRLILDGSLHAPLPKDVGMSKMLFSQTHVSYGNAAELGVLYTSWVSRHLALEIQYRFWYVTNTTYEPLKLYSNELLFGFRYSFQGR